jgi:putative heme-binding domain-containing protein
VAPAGDVYGGGSPTGNVFYENGALGDAWTGTFFAADAGRNEIFAYRPVRRGGGFDLGARTVVVTTNPSQQYAGSDFAGGNATAKGAPETLFRPSDIAVGPDGALYVADWIDPRVGGHVDLDDSMSGAIYRIAPKGFVSKVPRFDPSTLEGLVTALRSPAVNVRAIGFDGLKTRGAAAVPAVAALLDDPNPYVRGRALYLLYQLGPDGQRRAGTPDAQTDPAMRIAAYRAMRRAGLDAMPAAARLARDADAGVRREVALSLRDEPAARALPILVEIARGLDPADRSYLEALGTGASGKDAALYDALVRELRVPKDPIAWSPAFAAVAWRLHVPAAAGDLAQRARSSKLSLSERRAALDALAFIDTPAAADAVLRIAGSNGPLRELATWWLLNRLSNSWAAPDYNLRNALKVTGIYDPDAIKLEEIVKPRLPANAAEPSIDEILATPGDAGRGKDAITRCLMCHAVNGTGAELGPALDGWGRGKSPAVIARAIVQPSAEIAAGYDATELRTTDGLTIQGLLIKEGDPLMMRSQGGVTQIVPISRVASRRRMTESLMLSPSQLGLTARDVADLIAFLRAN